MTDTAQLERDLLAAVDAARNERALDDVRVSALGKKGAIAELLKTPGAMSPDERKAKGAAFNALRDVVRGVMALVKLQVSSQPGLNTVVQSLELGGTGKTVTLGFEVPANVFEALAALRKSQQSPAPLNH